MSETSFSPVSAPPPLPARRRERWGLHLFLLGLTLLTTTWAGVGMATGEPVPTSLSNLMTGLPYALMVMAIFGAHEMGHYLACLHYGVDASPPYFLPSYPWPIGTFGAFIRLRQQMPDRKVLFDVGVAGPLAGFVVTLPVLAWAMLTAQSVPLDGTGGIEFGEPLLLQGMAWLVGRAPGAGETLLLNPAMMAAWVGCLATSLNLLPVGQLDGGHIAYAVSRAFHKRMAPVALVVFSLVSIAFSPGYIVFAMVLVFVGSRHPEVRDEQGDIGTGRRLIALLALVMLILCFVPGPISLPEITGG